jgi:hypothetical protein
MTETDKPVRREASDAELDVAYSGPAPAANRMLVTLGNSGVRIAFAEQQAKSDKLHFRSAVVLHPIDAIKLYRILKDMLKDIEPQLEGLAKYTEASPTDVKTISDD